jgi:hypothetical protein
VIKGLQSYEAFLKNSLERKPTFEEMVDLPLEQLLKIGYPNLRQNQKWFRQVAGKSIRRRRPSISRAADPGGIAGGWPVP